MNQLSIAFAQRDLGMARAELGAANDEPEWSRLALEFLREYAKSHATFPAYFVVAEAEKHERLRGHPKAFGVIFRTALKRGIIAKTTMTVPHPGRHGCPAYVYASLVRE